MADASSRNRVAILLCTFNGAPHLLAQLESIRLQTWTNWSLWISDDGSSDATLAVVDDFMRRHGDLEVHVLQGPRQGFAANYMSLIGHGGIQAGFFAFCDQDDIWLPGRLAASVQGLSTGGDPGLPGLYCARTRYIDEHGRVTGESRPAPAMCTFERALAHNVCGGNTMLINEAARALMQKVPAAAVAAHDWLAYLLVTGAGGFVVWDPRIFVQYRQHADNAMGENRSLRARWHRVWRLWQGDLRRWTDMNLRALESVRGSLTPASESTFQRFAAARSGPPWSRLARLKASGVRRQGRAAQLAYCAALICNRV